MAINPNIALGIQQPQPVNMLGQYAQVMAIRAAQQEMEGNEGFRSALAGGMEATDPRILQYGRPGRETFKAAGEGRIKQLEAASKSNEILGGIFGGVINWLKKVYQSIVDGFADLLTGIRLMLVDLFVPHGTAISDKIDELRSNTETQFGFLYYPFEVIQNLNDRFEESEDLCAEGATSQECRGYVSFGSLNIGTGQNSADRQVALNLPAFEAALPALYAGLKILVISLVVFGLIFSLHHKYMDIIRR